MQKNVTKIADLWKKLYGESCPEISKLEEYLVKTKDSFSKKKR